MHTTENLSFRKLIVYQKTKTLVLQIYQITKLFPREELYGITSQLRRAVASILLNIAEGYVRKSKKDFSRFIDIAMGSCAEVDVLLELAIELGYLNSKEYARLAQLRDEVARLLFSFRRSLNSGL